MAAPVLAIAGWAYDSHGEEALKNARRADREVDSATAKLDKAGKMLCNVEDYSRRIKRTLTSIFGHFNQYFDSLKNINTFEVYLHVYESVSDARQRIGRFIEFYNTRRPHSSLGKKTPDEFYFASLPATQQAA